MNIWAHRGCSQLYPENTMTAFERAMNIPGLKGIELDIQLTKDGELVVIHDEKVDRTTDGTGFVRDFMLKELNSLHIDAGTGKAEHIPTMKEVLSMLKPRLKAEGGIMLNIELKNGVYPYPGMETKIASMVHEYDVQDAVIYSSFYADSLVKLHAIDNDVRIGVLDRRLSDCLYKAMGIETILGDKLKAPIALHPSGKGLDISVEKINSKTVRAWFGGYLYPEKPTGGKMDIDRLVAAGVTDVFLNEPDRYVTCGM